MKMLWIRSMVAVGAALSGACSSDAMTDGTADMHAAIGDARAENTRHLEACNSAESLTAVMDELVRHESGMSTTMGRMQSVMDGMSHCAASGMARMSEDMSLMGTNMSDHRAELESASDVETARGECSAHAQNMDNMLLDMSSELDGMSCMSMSR